MDGDHNILCPDYWKLEKVPEYIKQGMVYNNVYDVNNNIIPEINRVPNTKIKYRCVYDKNVYGNTEEYNTMNNELIKDDKFIPGFTSVLDVNKYTDEQSKKIKNTILPDYIVTSYQDKASEHYNNLKKYAMFSGAYSTSNELLIDPKSSNMLRVFTENKPYNNDNKVYHLNEYKEATPLICNVVYPQVLGVLDSETKDKNEVSCEYAKQCGISWSSLNCK
jgi:hypothetical protein